MGIIKQMPDFLANQIAAGEVVERPASVVKELVENAIDAESTQIIVELIEAGIQQIKVSDNGKGIIAEDLPMAFMAHATSKIYETTDLFNINSLGFRGEALASIGSVSKVRVESMTEDDDSRHFIEIEGSKIIEEGLTQAKIGTTVEVNSLFYNTPARLKHLKTIKTELSHSLKFIQNIALAYPNIRFKLTHNGQEIFASHGNDNLQQVIASVYQPALARDLIPIQSESDDFSINGFISKPTLTRTSKQYIHWIINGRSVKSYMLDEVLIKAYGRQLMIGRYPIGIIRIQLDPRLVDVNVHPTKQTVRLSKEDELSELITQAVHRTLDVVNPIPSLEESDLPNVNRNNTNYDPVQFNFTQKTLSTNNEPNRGQDTEPEAKLTDYKEQLQNALNNNGSNRSSSIGEPTEVNYQRSEPTNETIQTTDFDPSTTNKQPVEESKRYSLDFYSLRYVGQIHGTYLIAENETGFYLIDQHAAQERIRYEDLMNEEVDVSIQQQLLMPIIINFTTSEMEIISELEEQFEKLGLYLELMGPTSYKLESYPDWLYYEEVEGLVTDLVELLNKQPDLTVQELKERSIIMQSCRGAIKANHYLDDKQAIALIHGLDGLEDPYHCPHGRPVFVEFDQNTLEKLFKRIQDTHERGVFR
ncbi:DNA mismatch repair endonuclease MutL [Ruoffia tabacinasalis]|uniref:DNA mismatch repair protein MutL n=1 Tax=Ruoffia tabacinasalis TaxID=87458 RepID=A0A5R9ELH5_9LACT|nr:DNA mismatch repair endonuclease MutL [Ruoffia tabacinasalis]TLQ49167.1 DNA mismatch repair endonuclease MutL [Ruoffia tabacinasalis]